MIICTILFVVGVVLICCFENNSDDRDPDSHPEGTHLD